MSVNADVINGCKITEPEWKNTLLHND